MDQKKEAVYSIFEVIRSMEELRDLFRKTAPSHKFTPLETEEARRQIAQARRALDKIENYV